MDLDLHVIGDFDDETIRSDGDDTGIDPGAGQDLVAALQLLEHLGVLLLSLALGRDHQEPHAGKEQEEDENGNASVRRCDRYFRNDQMEMLQSSHALGKARTIIARAQEICHTES